MAIVSSTVIEDMVQRDGRRFITERHVDQTGMIHFVRYMAESKAAAEDMLPIRAAQIEQQLDDQRARDAAEAVALKERATELLKLTDESLAKVLMVDRERAAAEKAELEKQANAKAEADGTEVTS